MKLRIFLIFISSLIIAACGKNNGEEFIGLWERKNVEFRSFIQISREGENLIVRDNVFIEPDKINLEESSPFPLTRQDDQWLGPFGIAIALSENDELMIAGDTYGRVDDTRLVTVREEIKAAKAERERLEAARKKEQEARQKARDEKEAAQRAERAITEKNRAACSALISQYTKDDTKIRIENTNALVEKKLVDKLQEKYREKLAEIPNCRMFFSS